MVKLKGKEFIFQKLMADLKGKRKMADRMDGEGTIFQMVIIVKVNIKMEKEMEWEFICGLMVVDRRGD